MSEALAGYRHSVRLKTTVEDGEIAEASFTYDERTYAHGTNHGSMGYCIACALHMLHIGSAQSLLYDLADAVQYLCDYDPFEGLDDESEQDKAERDAAWRMMQAANDFVELRKARRAALILKASGGGEKENA
jgi:hypothetical protein